MSKNGNISNNLARLDDVLAIYGANPARWPGEEREALTVLVHGDASASRLLDEAAALEKVMSHAPAGNADRDFRNRIVAAAINDPRREARVVPISAARGPRRGFGTAWSATAMAACFALGLYLGVAGMGSNTIDTALNMASLDGSAAEDADALDLFSDSDIIDPDGLI